MRPGRFDRARRLYPLVLIALFLAGGPLRAAAQDDAIPQPRTPAPEACTAEPRTEESIVAIFASATPIASVESPSEVTIPLGQQALPSVAADVTATIEMAFACLNAGDFPRFFALLTDNAIATNFSWIGGEIVDGSLPDYVLPAVTLSPEYQQTILGIGGISRVGDGIFTAVVVFIDPSAGDSTSALLLTLIMQDDGFLIDGVVDFNSED